MDLDLTIVLQLLRTKSHLPDKIRDTLQHADSLPALFSRIETQCPELESAVTILIKRICGLRACSTESHAVDNRCAELILAIQDLKKLFPLYKLNKSEALTCLASLHTLNPTIMAIAKRWSEAAKITGNHSIRDELSVYIDSVREMSAEARFAIALHGHDSSGTRSHLNFKKTGDQAAPGAKPKTKAPPAPKKKAAVNQPAAATATKKAMDCRVCKKKHTEYYHNCPHLKIIQHGKVKLPSTCCKNCIGHTDAAGKCVKGNNCHILI